MHFLTCEQSRNVDRVAIEQWGVPGIVLMENAARGVAERCRDILRQSGAASAGPLTICCGKGNNGGDGFAAARLLRVFGIESRVWLFADPDLLNGDARTNYRILEKLGIPIRVFREEFLADFESDLDSSSGILDALLGTGAKGPPLFPIDLAIRTINRIARSESDRADQLRKPWVLAVDLPSGLDADSGIPNDPTVIADHTCTFYAPKVGFQAAPAKPYLGLLHIADIGIVVVGDK